MSGEKEPLKGKAGSSEPKTLYFLNKETADAKAVEMASITATLPVSGVNNPPTSSSKSTWLSAFFRPSGYAPINAIQKPRKVPIKVEPKVFFANERTFLAWLHMSLTLASIALAIVAFAEANRWSQLYGLCLLPVAIAFCAYSLYVFMKRAAMIRKKIPGPYEERTGPVVLACMLGLAICANFVVKLYEIKSRR